MSSKPNASGVYAMLNADGDHVGFALYDYLYKIWGCTNGDMSTAIRKADYEFAEQDKEWRELTADESIAAYKALSKWLHDSIENIAKECKIDGEEQVLIDASRSIDVARVML